MSLPVDPQPLPLLADADGMIRVGGTRVTLDTIVAAFRSGVAAEAILEQYPSLALADVYLVIGWLLRHQVEVDTYLAGRGEQAAEVRRQNEAKFDPNGIRARLLARRGQG